MLAGSMSSTEILASSACCISLDSLKDAIVIRNCCSFSCLVAFSSSLGRSKSYGTPGFLGPVREDRWLPFSVPSDTLACLKSFPFNETLRQNVLTTISRVFDFYTFEEFYLNSPPPFQESTTNIRADIAKINSTKYEVRDHLTILILYVLILYATRLITTSIGQYMILPPNLMTVTPVTHLSCFYSNVQFLKRSIMQDGSRTATTPFRTCSQHPLSPLKKTESKTSSSHQTQSHLSPSLEPILPQRFPSTGNDSKELRSSRSKEWTHTLTPT